MNSDRRTALERLRRLLDDIKAEVESLKVEGQSACVEQLERGVVSIQRALENINPVIDRDEADTAIDEARMSFGTWLKNEMRKGASYASLADAAAAYEAAGYEWLED
jgi:hypothetical protein